MKKILFYFVLTFASTTYAKLPQKVVLCGVCKNVGGRLAHSMKIMEKIGELFADYRIVVYENNSSDGTARSLKLWQIKNSKVRALSENVSAAELNKSIVNRLDNGELFRPECIARARNIVLSHAMAEEYNNFEYLIWMDMDFVLEPSYEGFIETFNRSDDWDAVFAYGVDPECKYWDWYAFRDVECPIGSELLGNYWWYRPKKLHLTKEDAWYPVLSAFGGCGIYKKEAIKHCYYSALVNRELALFYEAIIKHYAANQEVQKYLDDCKTLNQSSIYEISSLLPDVRDKVAVKIPAIHDSMLWQMSSFVYKYPSVCEHVTFHAAMILQGHDRLFINPRLVFRYGDWVK